MKRTVVIICIAAALAAIGLLLLTTDWSVGSGSAPVAPDSTPGVRLGAAEELTVMTQDATLRFAAIPRVVPSNTDGKTLVGVIIEEVTNKIVAIDLTSGAIRVLYDGTAYPREPRVSENNVVWTTLGSLYLYNLSTGDLEQKNFDIVRYARISGDVAVWEQNAGDIWGYDLRSKNIFPIATQPDVLQVQPEVSKEWAIYHSPPGYPDSAVLWATNVRTRETIQLSSFSQYYLDDPDRRAYAIDAPWVVWSAEAELHLYNLDTRSAYTVTVEQCISPAVVPGGSAQRLRPESVMISAGVVIFDCTQSMGYDIEHGLFFSIPLYTPQALQMAEQGRLSFTGWTFADGRLVWVLTEDAFSPQEHSRIFTAQIERSP